MKPLAPIILLTLGACFGNETTEFPPGLEVLEVNMATAPEVDAGGHLPEEIKFVGGERGDLYFTHARGFIRAPLAAVWTAMQDPEVVIDRRQVDQYTWDRDVEVGYDVSFVVHNTVDNVITVNFDITWRQSAIAGTREEPEHVAMRFEKTNGTTTISKLRASISILQADEEAGVTELRVEEQLDALSGDNGTLESYIRDLHASVVARVNGRPLPTY